MSVVQLPCIGLIYLILILMSISDCDLGGISPFIFHRNKNLYKLQLNRLTVRYTLYIHFISILYIIMLNAYQNIEMIQHVFWTSSSFERLVLLLWRVSGNKLPMQRLPAGPPGCTGQKLGDSTDHSHQKRNQPVSKPF